MNRAVAGLLLLLVIGAVLLFYWRISVRRHHKRLHQLDLRLHVNGIRGKSTVTRLLAGVLREGGYVTVAKTTGSAARVIGPYGTETPIFRRGAANINEQIDVVAEHIDRNVEALVIECMAVRPLYQEYSQDYMVRSDITVITNVREDHQEEMGETLEQIADSMSVTIPRGGVLITAEDRPHLRERLRKRAEERGSTLVYADPAGIDDEDMRGFDYLQFKANVAVGLAVARLAGVGRQAALDGMWKSVPDIGVVRLRSYDIRGKSVLWVPMFAANDRESVVLTFATLQAQFPPGATVVGILNNRRDRGRRAELFAHLVPDDLAQYLDHVVTFGAYETTVTKTMTERGYAPERIHQLGETVQPSLDEILDTVAGLIDGDSGVLVGMVNIHTDQAELLIDHFRELRGADHRDEMDESRDPRRASLGVTGSVARPRGTAGARTARRRSGRMFDYGFAPEVVRVALVVGVVLSMLFYERMQLTTGGAIVPAYLALNATAPLAIAVTVAVGYVTYLLVSVLLAKRLILYGRRKFECEMLVGLGLILICTVLAGILGDYDPTLFALAGIGFLVPGIIAHDMSRQQPARTTLAIAATTVILMVFLVLVATLMSIAPGAESSEGAQLASVLGYPRELLLLAVALSVLVGMLVFGTVGLRSGGFITGAYLALVGPRVADIVFALVVAVLTWFLVVRVLMPRLLIFGRRKLSTMVLVGAIVAWGAELLVMEFTKGDYVPWRGLTIATLMVPALLANDAQRQGWERTLWGSALTAVGVFAGTNLIAAAAIAAGVL
ncbi:poly-gamma-glutamate synthase PgsB [Nocardia sp. NPDC058499]|uniref:poly-gamma-glutamate synthase PgsB n=1 Tax=Nocardia sp. NPDC058499 TaxID=3346530 RepID=UPI00365FB45B